MKKRISIYQVLPRLFDNANCTNQHHGSFATNGAGKLDAFTPAALAAIKGLGCTHIWYTGVIEHATKSKIMGIKPDHPDLVKGEAGSPYAIKDYYDIAPELASIVGNRQEEFDALVERTHQAGMGVIIDFVPNHVARQYHSDAKPSYVRDFGEDDDKSTRFSSRNNFYYLPNEYLRIASYEEYPARATGNNQFTTSPTPNDWYETVKLNYGVDYLGDGSEHFHPIPDTWEKMLDILTFWATRGVDGFRCDMAEMVPISFWDWAITQLHKGFPHIIFIAEVYQPHLYQDFVSAGFDFLYDKVWLYDTLIRIIKGNGGTDEITKIWQCQEHLRGQMLHFMENHDEPRLASDLIAGSGIKAFPAMAVSTLIDTAPIMTYFGQELGESGMDSEGFSGLDGRTSIFDYWSLRSMQQWIGADKSYMGKDLPADALKLREDYQKLLNLSISYPSITNGMLYDLMYANPTHSAQGLYTFVRHYQNEIAIIVVNFSGEHRSVEINLPPEFFTHLGLDREEIYLIKEEPSGLIGLSQLPYNTPYCMFISPYHYTIHRCKPTDKS